MFIVAVVCAGALLGFHITKKVIHTAMSVEVSHQTTHFFFVLQHNVYTIDLVLIDPQSVGKRTHDLLDTVNVKKRWKTIYWRVNKYLK
jgi:hypothetical protein